MYTWSITWKYPLAEETQTTDSKMLYDTFPLAMHAARVALAEFNFNKQIVEFNVTYIDE